MNDDPQIVIVELEYLDETLRYLELDIAPAIVVSKNGNKFPGVVCDDPTDEDAELICDAINRRSTEYDFTSFWQKIYDWDDPRPDNDLIIWRVIDGVDLLIDHGIVDAPGDIPLPL